jgi:hypothetical protein
MTTDQECVDYARECVRLAGLTKDDLELRDYLLGLARDWMATATHEDKTHHPKSLTDNRPMT